MRFKIDWSSHIVGSKFTVFALFYFVFEGNFPSTSPRGAYIWRGNLTEGFLRYRIEGLIFGGAYTWRGLFSEFYGTMFWHSAAICGLSLLLVLSLAPRGFSPVTPVFPGPQNRRPTFPNSNLIWNVLVWYVLIFYYNT